MSNQSPNLQRVNLHSTEVSQFLEEVSSQTVTPQEQRRIEYQRIIVARKKSLKKINNIEAAIRGKLQELEFERCCLNQYNQMLAHMEQEIHPTPMST